ncbi:MAG: hypothetical protein FWH38_05235 [Treponema sp.]|nr:hypothetical protein [Treponema sp.]
MSRLVTGLKLLLLGHSETESSGEPWPVVIPGEKAVSSRKIGEYLDEGFWHYYRVYTNCVNCGLPHGSGWLDEPPWVVQLVSHFSSTVEQIRNQNIRKGAEWRN